MAPLKMMLNEIAWDESYRVGDADNVMTPALVVYPEAIEWNISRMLAALGGDADRWRAHVKTAKLGFTMRMLTDRAVRNFKCATTLELLVACESGAEDVLVAYPVVGANAARVREIAKSFPKVRVSALVENKEQVWQWRNANVGIFLDINPGMNRTGLEQERVDEIAKLVRAIREAGLEFRGLHYYDGQYGGFAENERVAAAHAGYEGLLRVVSKLEQSATKVTEVITAGTPTFSASLSFAAFRGKEFVHRISPGTVVYNDATNLAQLPTELGYKPAVLVMTRVVSRPREGMITCDAGHKSVSADAGVPTCIVSGHSELTPLGPSEEHLPMSVSDEADGPKVGDILYLLPRHVCPTVNNFDFALIVRGNRIEAVERVTARGREMPRLQPSAQVASAAHES
jgi:D-serine deaminase-like pyridoxal phosphate-dependent protein